METPTFLELRFVEWKAFANLKSNVASLINCVFAFEKTAKKVAKVKLLRLL